MEKHGWTVATRANAEAPGRLKVDRAPVMSWIANTEAFCTYFNGIWLEDSNRTIKQNIEKGWLEGIHPEDFQSCRDAYLAAVADRQPFQIEYRWHCGDGDYRWILNAGLPQPTKEGNFGGYVGSCIDITERKNAEIASRIAWEETVSDRSSAKPVSLENNSCQKVDLPETRFFTLALDLLCVASQDGYFKRLNPAWEKTLGYTCEELLSKPFIQFVHPEDFTTTLEATEQLGNGTPIISFENRYRCKDRSYKWLAWTAMSLPEEGSIYAIARDITLAKQVEDELRESEERLRATFDQAAVGITQIGLDCRFLKVNQKFCDIVGYAESELLGQRFQDITDLADLKTQMEYIRQLVCGEIETFSMEKRYVHKNDSPVWVNLAMSLVRESSGDPKYLIGVVQDISDRISLEKELALRQARFDAFFTAAPAGLAIFDQQLRYVQINETLAEIDGLPAREHIGKSLHQILGERSLILEPIYRQILKTNKAILNLEMCLEIPQNPGVKRHWVGSYFPLPGEDGMPLGVGEVVVEITDRKRAEEALKASETQLREQATHLQTALHELQQTQSQLIQTEKMSSLGQLVAGVAHEINNPVSFIYGNVIYASEYIQNLLELLVLYQQHYPNPVAEIVDAAEDIDLDFLVEDLPKLLSSMKMGAERIRDIVLSLRNFSRLDESDMKPVDIHSGIDSTLMILGNRLKETAGHPSIQVIKEYGNLPQVECYVGQVNQVFMNVLSNAIDALEIGDGGLGTGDWELGNSQSPIPNPPSPIPTIRIRTEAIEGNRVLIRIFDNGPGMSEAVRLRLFDPFFTTKPLGKGTGLGLSISYQIIVEKHKGSLRCISAPGKGAEFIIEIPLQQSNAVK